MNKAITTILATFLLTFSLNAQQINFSDTTSQGLTKEDISLILGVFDTQQIPVIIQQAEKLVMVGKDSLQKAQIASDIFTYYYTSKIMGHEAVALHFADNYFLNKKYDWPNEEGYYLLSLFAEYNRSSMIGMNAPELILPDSLGNEVSIRDITSDYKVLYFYDDGCSVCKIFTPKLMESLKDYSGKKLSLIRIYAQDSRDKWINYVREADAKYHTSPKVTVTDVWDPEMNSDFQKKYAVLKTPQMFLLDKDNVILGRNLTPKALIELIELIENQASEAEIFIDNLFTSILPSDRSGQLDTTLVTGTIDDLYKRSIHDTTFFNEFFLDMYLYLKHNPDYELQRGAAYLANNYIVKKPELWKNANFSGDTDASGKKPLKLSYSSNDVFINDATRAVELFYRNPLGVPVTDLALTSINKSSYSIYDSNAEYTVLFFYNMDCAACEASAEDLKKLYSQYSEKGLKILAIYTGKDRKGWQKYVAKNGFEWDNLWDKSGKSGMFSKYDLSSVPSIYLLDKEKKALAKDISPLVLGDILNYLIKD